MPQNNNKIAQTWEKSLRIVTETKREASEDKGKWEKILNFHSRTLKKKKLDIASF